MAKLKQWLREWLGIEALERSALRKTSEYEIRISGLQAQYANLDAEIDRLRSIICTTPEQVKKTYKPRNWRETTQLMGKV